MLKRKNYEITEKFRTLYGDPHFIALGMAIGVFVAMTPTIPFHMIIAITLAVLFKASKPAAVLGAWVSNPFTVVFLYIACYKTGHFFFDDAPNAMASIQNLLYHIESDIEVSEKIRYFIQFVNTKIQTFAIMNVGGIILGLPAGGMTYLVTKWFFTRQKQKKILKGRKNK